MDFILGFVGQGVRSSGWSCTVQWCGRTHFEHFQGIEERVGYSTPAAGRQPPASAGFRIEDLRFRV